MGLALDVPDLSNLQRVILCHLARASDKETHVTFIGQQTIASKLGMSRQNVTRAINGLVKLGYVERRESEHRATKETVLLVDNMQEAITAAASARAESGNMRLRGRQHEVATEGNMTLPSTQHEVATHATTGCAVGNNMLPVSSKLSSQLSEQVSGAGVIKSVISAREGHTATDTAPVDNNGYPVCEGQTDVLSELATGSERKPTHTEALQRARLRAQEEKRQRSMHHKAS